MLSPARLILLAATLAVAAWDEPRALVIRDARLIDGTGVPARDVVTIVIDRERIAAVGAAADVKVPAGAQIVDARGKTVIPGLIDTHVHFRDYVAELFLAHGVTTVCDAGNPTDWILALRQKQAAGEMRGPRIFSVGGILDAPPAQRAHHIAVGTPDEARAAVRQLVAAGVDALKVYAKMTPELLRSVAVEAHGAGRRVMGHVTMSARDAAFAGLDSLEHASGIAVAVARDPDRVREIPDQNGVFGFRFMDAAKADELIQVLVQRKVTIAPALASWARGAPQRGRFQAEAARVIADPGLGYLPVEAKERITGYVRRADDEIEDLALAEDYHALKLFLRRFSRAGGRIVAGTDGGVLAGLSVHHELELLVDAGLSPVEAIAAATGEAAALLQANDLGTVAPGRIADLVVIDGNPLASIAETKKISLVIQRGRVVDTRYHQDYRIPIPRPAVAGSSR